MPWGLMKRARARVGQVRQGGGRRLQPRVHIALELVPGVAQIREKIPTISLETAGDLRGAGLEPRYNLIDKLVGLLHLLQGVSLILIEFLGGLRHLEIDPAQDLGQFLGGRRSRRGPGKSDGIKDRLQLL